MSQFEFLLLVQTFVFYGLFLGSGILLWFFPPKMNNWYGFRTSKALKNENNWNFAQAESSKLILIIAPICLTISLLIKYLTDFNYLVLTLYSIIDILLLIVSTFMIYFLTEDKLRKFIREQTV